MESIATLFPHYIIPGPMTVFEYLKSLVVAGLANSDLVYIHLSPGTTDAEAWTSPACAITAGNNDLTNNTHIWIFFNSIVQELPGALEFVISPKEMVVFKIHTNLTMEQDL